MSRSHLRYIVEDTAGNVVQNALVRVYQPGTTTPVTDMYAASSGGGTITTLTSNNQGEVESWFTSPQTVDLLVTDNSGTAYYPWNPAGLYTFGSFTETVEVYPPPLEILYGDASYALVTTSVLRTRVVADAQPRYVLHAGGLQEWGDGTNPPDVSLQRTAQYTLGITGALVVTTTSAYNGEVGHIAAQSSVTPAKRLYMGYDDAIDAGYIQAIQSGVVHKPLALNPVNGNVVVGQAVASARFHVKGGNAGDVVSLVTGATSQTADLQRWTDSTVTTLARISADGVASVARLTAGTGVYDPVGDIASARIDAYSSGARALLLKGAGNPPTAATADALVIESTTAAGLFVGPAVKFQGHSGNGVDPYPFAAIQGYKGSTTAGDYNGGFRVRTTEAAGGLLDRLDVGPGATFIYPSTNVGYGLIVQGLAGQAEALTAWRDSTSNTLAYIAAGGNFVTTQDVYAHVADSAQMYMGTGGPAGQAGLIFGITSPTNLYLTSATTLRTDGNLQTAGYLAVGVVSSGWALNNGSAAGGGGVGGVLSYGTGAPVNASGANGDIYLRVDGGALTTIYQRRAGAWVGIV